MRQNESVNPLADIDLLDVTIRDGGYVNQHSWSTEQARQLAGATVQAGIRRVEIGYFRPARHAVDGETAPAASCPPRYIEALRREVGGRATVVVMAHLKDVRRTDYAPLAAMGVGLVRLPVKVAIADRVGEHVAAVREAGMAAAVNLIRITEVPLDDVLKVASVAQEAGASAFYVADSNGAMFPEQVSELVGAIRSVSVVPLGFHAHDGLSMAFGNSLAAARVGAVHLDASIGGLGKGGGNLSMQLIAGYLRSRVGAPYDITPLARATADVLSRWKGDSRAECESIVSGLLDLNMDEIQRARADSSDEIIPLLNRTGPAAVPAAR